MANYYGKVRTNYFRVTDEKKYLEIRKGLRGTEDTIEFWDEEHNGILVHGFGCDSLLNYQKTYGTLESYANSMKENDETWENIAIYRDCTPLEAEHEESCVIDDFPEEDWSSWSIYHLEQMDDRTTRIFVSKYSEDFSDSNMIMFYQEMQKILPDGEAMIVMEVGSEKLCYLVGCATIVTKAQMESIDLETYALEKARKMLGDPNFITKLDY